jgi:hypothetical protein
MAGLTKKQFKAIAEILNKEQQKVFLFDGMQAGRNAAIGSIVKELSQYFKTQNPQFDEAKFKEACLK